jgi:hypothetical protein
VKLRIALAVCVLFNAVQATHYALNDHGGASAVAGFAAGWCAMCLLWNLSESHAGPITVELSVEDLKRLPTMLDVHVRPVYFEASEGGDFPEFGREELERCDRLSDIFRHAIPEGPK